MTEPPAEQPYHKRTASPNSDGSPLFQTQQDLDNERLVAEMIEANYGCKVYKLGNLDDIDYYIYRDGRPVAFAELKTHPYPSTKHSHAWLNLRKWCKLLNYHFAWNRPIILYVKYTDKVLWIDVNDIDATKQTVAGTKSRVKSFTDAAEPIILIPINQMNVLSEKKEEKEAKS